MKVQTLHKRLDLAVRQSGLPPALIGRMFGFDGRTLKSWRLSGVPVGKRQAVERLVETLNILVTKQVLPIDILDLALIGLSKLERDHG